MAASRNKPFPDLPARVGAFLATRLPADARLCVGLSGGCDSIVLLRVLADSPWAGQLSAMHVHHGLSPNADDWAAFCGDVCGEHEIPLKIARVTVPLNSPDGPEAAARTARHAALADCGADVLLLAHHRGDQAETVLFNLVRGAGVAGAAGIPVMRKVAGLTLLRPLLDISRAEIEAHARVQGWRWIDDESNVDQRYSRNFLRHAVLPGLTARFPAAEAMLAQAAGHFAEADELLGDLAALDWQAVAGDGDSAAIKALRTLPLPRLKNLLRWRLRELGWRAPVAARLDEFSRQLLSAAPDRHPSLNLPDGQMRVAGRHLHWFPTA